MKMRIFIILILFMLLSASTACANNLVISNVTLEDRNASANTMVVQFDISWDHSWRKNDGRHDAAWVFVKILVNSTAPHRHGILTTAGTNPVDVSSGTNSDVKIVIPSDKVGAFISRQATGSGTFSSKKVRLSVTYSDSVIDDPDTVQVKVFGIEMVYIPEGPFYLGDGDGTQESWLTLHQNGVDNTTVQITTTGKAITEDTNIFDDIDTSPVTVTGLAGITGNTSWPNGYSAFYLMKYELSQAAYVDFLNTLSRVQQGTRVAETISGDTITKYYVMTQLTSVNKRQSVRAPASGNGTSPTTVVFGVDLNSNGIFNESDDGKTNAMNVIKWQDQSAYADWAGLRPITELEFEKAARGPNSAVFGEYSWGTTKITQPTSILNSGTASEVAGQTGEGLTTYGNAGGVQGPLRSGFAASNATNRKSSGAGYYGNMDLSGNLWELTVRLGDTSGRAFTGTHGDGTLTTTASYEGNATNNDWPGIDATTNKGVTGASGAIMRGADWNSSVSTGYLAVSDRGYIAISAASRGTTQGIRLGRTSP